MLPPPSGTRIVELERGFAWSRGFRARAGAAHTLVTTSPGIAIRLRGVWAYDPLDDEFVEVATTTADLVEGHTTGRITV